jgi:hypothetical protein
MWRIWAIFFHGNSKLYFSGRNFAVEYETTFPWFCLFKQQLEKSTDTKANTFVLSLDM